MCLEIYELDTAHFLSAPGLAWEIAIKKDQSEIESTNWYWYALQVENVTLFINIQNLITNSWKIMIEKRTIISEVLGCI